MLSDIIKKARAKKGLTGKELASRAGVCESYLSQIENNRTIPSLDKVTALSFVLGVPVKDMITAWKQAKRAEFEVWLKNQLAGK